MQDIILVVSALPKVVDTITKLNFPCLNLDMIGIKKVSGGSLLDSTLVNGVAFKKASLSYYFWRVNFLVLFEEIQ